LALVIYGAVKGNIVWVIYDTDGETVVGSDAPIEVVTVYFVPQGEDVNLSAEMECNSVGGALNNVDADEDGTACIEYKYDSPTAYECTIEVIPEVIEIKGAKEKDPVEIEKITIYKITTSLAENNQGCFAAKIPCGDYDIYI